MVTGICNGQAFNQIILTVLLYCIVLCILFHVVPAPSLYMVT